ncbi:developmental pluripotency-associated protein 3 [Rhynchonycteris naso]
MDSPKVSPSSTPESSEMPHEEGSAGTQAESEVLAKNLSNLTLNPSTKFPSLLPEAPLLPAAQQQDGAKNFKGLGLGLGEGTIYRRRRGVRTLATARKERMQRMLQIIRYRTISLIESRFRRFRCSCRYCLYHGDISDNISMENNSDMESI